jgi:hypothetical protein
MRNGILRKGLFGWILGAAMLASVAMIGSVAYAQDLFTTEPSQTTTAHKAPPLDVAGTWSGPIDDSVAGPGTVEFQLTQQGETVGGTWSFEFNAGSGIGTVTGKATSKSVKLKFHVTGATKGCDGIFASTSATSGSITGDYQSKGCGGTDDKHEKGTITLSP